MVVYFPGYVPAVPPAPLEGTQLQDFLQSVLVGITGLPGPMVRPRWQVDPPNIPDAGTIWCAFGITQRKKDTFAYTWQEPGDDVDGISLLQRQEELDVLASFYDLGSSGQADLYAELLADGLQVPQNREVLDANGYAFVSSGDPTPMPVLLKMRWLYRVDVALVIRRQINRTYAVPNIESAVGTISTDTPSTTTNILVEPEE